MPQQGELVWFYVGDGTWEPALWLASPMAPDYKYPTVILEGTVHRRCHYTRFRRGEKPTHEAR